MKIIVLRDNLVNGLASVERVIGAGSNLPILKNILITARDGGVVVTATNLELAVTREISGKVLETGEVTCPFQILNSIVKNIAAERVTLERAGKKLFITTDNYEAHIQCQDPKEYPLIPSIQNPTLAATISAARFAEAMGSVVVATQYTDIRPEISGVLVRFYENQATFVATDSFRLAEFKLTGAGAPDDADADAIVPLRTAEEALRIAQGAEKESSVVITMDTNQISFESATTRLISRLIDGHFPEYQAILPKEVKHEAEMDREEFLRAIKLASAFSGRANDLTLVVADNKKSLELSSSDAALGENRCRVALKMKGEKFSITFNWRYLLDGLKIYQGARVTLGVNAPDRPVLMKDATAPHLSYVVMPIRG